MNRILSLGLVISCLIFSAEPASTCFYPDGTTTEPNHKPCNTTISNSACCDPLDACTTTGICLGRSGFNYRGSCTDNTWTDSACPTSCRSDPFNKLPYSTFTPFWGCDKPGGRSFSYCCDSPTRNCCTIATFQYGTSGFAFKPGNDQVLQELLSVNSSGVAAVTVTVTASAGAASSTAALSDSSNSDNTPKPSSATSSNLGPTIGAAVGVPLGVLALGLLGFLFWRVRKNAGEKAQAPIEMDPGKPYYYAPPPPPPAPRDPAVEVSGWASQPLSRSTTRTDQKLSPGYNGGPAGVHELI